MLFFKCLFSITVNSDGEKTFEEEQIKAKISGSSSKSVTWSVADKSVATIDSNGLVTAVGEGTTVITAKHKSSGEKDKIDVEVFMILDDELVAQSGIFDFYDPYIFGYPDSTFKPENVVTRAEVATMFTKILKLDVELPTSKNFDDVSENEWFYKYVQAIAEIEVFKGNGDGTFRPNDPITRAEIAVVFSKVADYMSIETDGTQVSSIKNFDETHWASEYIYEMYNANIVSGNPDGTFGANESTLRQQVVVMINKLIGRPKFEAVDTKFTDLTVEHWAFGYIEAATQVFAKPVVEESTGN